MSKKVYPSWRYHKTQQPKIIQGENEESPEWLKSPAFFDAKAPLKPVAPVVVAPIVVTEPPFVQDPPAPEQPAPVDLAKLSKKELVDLAVKKLGLAEKELNKHNKAKLIDLLK